jgi:hypothetical protein
VSCFTDESHCNDAERFWRAARHATNNFDAIARFADNQGIGRLSLRDNYFEIAESSLAPDRRNLSNITTSMLQMID